MAKFIIHKDVQLYTTHGVVPARDIFSEYEKGKLSKDLRIAGFFNREEYNSDIKYMEKLESSIGYYIHLFAVGLESTNMIVYPEQKFYTTEGIVIDITNMQQTSLLLSLNGATEATLGDEIDNIEEYYIIEFNKPLPSLYANNLIIFPVWEVEKDNPFFTSY